MVEVVVVVVFVLRGWFAKSQKMTRRFAGTILYVKRKYVYVPNLSMYH